MDPIRNCNGVDKMEVSNGVKRILVIDDDKDLRFNQNSFHPVRNLHFIDPVRDKVPKAADSCLRQPISNGAYSHL